MNIHVYQCHACHVSYIYISLSLHVHITLHDTVYTYIEYAEHIICIHMYMYIYIYTYDILPIFAGWGPKRPKSEVASDHGRNEGRVCKAFFATFLG